MMKNLFDDFDLDVRKTTVGDVNELSFSCDCPSSVVIWVCNSIGGSIGPGCGMSDGCLTENVDCMPAQTNVCR